MIATGPTPLSEWALAFTNEDIRAELVFKNAASARSDLDLVAGHANALQALIGHPVEVDRVESRDKQKLIVRRKMTVADRDQHAEEVAGWCVATITALASAVSQLAVFAATG